jgi:uncharacterized protein YjeT (DUF2065 family)
MDKDKYSKDKWGDRAAAAFKILRTSAAFVLVVAVVSVIYAFFTHGRFWPTYIFTANIAIAAFLILTGIVVFAFPVRLKKSRLLDHSTVVEMRMDAREKKRKTAYMLIYTGICNIVITAIVQYLLSLIWR